MSEQRQHPSFIVSNHKYSLQYNHRETQEDMNAAGDLFGSTFGKMFFKKHKLKCIIAL